MTIKETIFETVHEEPVNSMCISEDGRLLATSEDDDIMILWNMETCTYKCDIETPEDDMSSPLMFEDDSRLIVDDFGILKRLEISSGVSLGEENHLADKGSYDWIHIIEKNKRALISQGDTVRVSGIFSSGTIDKIVLPFSLLQKKLASTDGKYLYTIVKRDKPYDSYDREGRSKWAESSIPSVVRWDLSKGVIDKSYGLSAPAGTSMFDFPYATNIIFGTGEDSIIVTYNGGRIDEYKTESTETVRSFQETGSYIQFCSETSDNCFMTIGEEDSYLSVWSKDTGDLSRRISIPSRTDQESDYPWFCSVCEGKYLAMITGGGKKLLVIEIETETTETVDLQFSHGWVSKMISKDNRLIIAGRDGSLRTFDIGSIYNNG